MSTWIDRGIDYSLLFIDWCEEIYLRAKDFIGHYWGKFSKKAQSTLDEVKPLWHSTYHASLALYAFYNTAKACISLLPVVITSITLFTAIPFLANLSSPVIYASVIGISLVSAYFKYKDSIFRHNQDRQIQLNKDVNEALTEEVTTLKESLHNLTQSMRSYMQAQVSQADSARSFLIQTEKPTLAKPTQNLEDSELHKKIPQTNHLK